MSGDTGDGQPQEGEGARRPRLLQRARVGWPPALRELKDLLFEMYLAAGAPTLDEISKAIADDDSLPGAPSRDTIRRAISDSERPKQQFDVVAVATILARRGAWDGPDLVARVRELWVAAQMAQGAGRPIGDLRDDLRSAPEGVLDHGLGIHPALDHKGASTRLGLLPVYVPREHDTQLKTVVDAAIRGRSGMAVLVGDSSTGKTRALWEAVGQLPGDWRVWHPLSPAATVAALPDAAPKTVVWLNETQEYLEPEPLGEQVAAGLRELLTDPSRAPVLILGTLWPRHWDTLTTSDRHPGARAVLGGRHKIDVPSVFTSAEVAALDGDDADPRLTQAARLAKGAQITQYLAGVPYLMERYRAAQGITQALIHAAIDARRLGAGPHIPLDWLADAAPGHLDDDNSETLDADWLTKALAWVTKPCNGIPGILTRVTASSPRNQRTRRTPVPSPPGPLYRLADYLDQHGRQHRAETIPPVDFWTAAAAHAHPADLTALGNAAWARGLYRDAAQLHKNATTHGDIRAAQQLVSSLRALHPADHRPAQWAAAHAALDDPFAVARLLGALQGAGVGAGEQATALLARDPAAHAALDDLDAVAILLGALQELGAGEQVTVLAKRVAAYTPLDNPYTVARLLMLHVLQAGEQVTALLARDPAAHAPLDDPAAVADLLQELRWVGAGEQVTALAERVAAHAALHLPNDVARLLQELRWVGAGEQVTALAERVAAHAALHLPN
ncbi:hypothetical protein AB0D86_47750, partial [Streptomyces sp. NPDC048324]